MEQGSYRLFSYHGTVLFLDPATHHLRHGNPDLAPRNLLLEVSELAGRLLYLSPTAEFLQLELDNSQGHVRLAPVGSAPDLRLHQVSPLEIALSLQGNYLSSDLDGTVRNDRSWCREWELYRLQRVEAPARMGSSPDGREKHQRTQTTDRAKISGFVITWNRESLVETCLRSIRFVDELIVVDKSSTDRTPEIARKYADKFIIVPWTPSADDTREYALSLCSHDLIAYLDDDECFSPDAIRFMLKEAENPTADVYTMPFRSYYLGRFDKRRRDWPEFHERFFRRGGLEFRNVTHHTVAITSNNRRWIPEESSIFVYHFSYAKVGEWIEKVNRYTSQSDRDSWFDKAAVPSRNFIQERMDYWLGSFSQSDDSYVAAYAMMRLIYDMTDLLKRWEARSAADVEVGLEALCTELQAEYAALGVENTASSANPESKEDTQGGGHVGEHRPKRILAVMLEFDTWWLGRTWSYLSSYALLDGLADCGIEYVVLPSLVRHGRYGENPWVAARETLLGGQRFDQAWVWIPHSHYSDEFFGWLAEVAPIRVAVLMESLRYTPEEIATWDELGVRFDKVVAQLRHMTHVLSLDEQDVAEVAAITGLPTRRYESMIPADLVQDLPAPEGSKALFLGTIYGKRQAFLKAAGLEEKLEILAAPEANTDLPARFDAVNQEFLGELERGDSSAERMRQYVDKLRKLRLEVLNEVIRSYRRGLAVVNLPALFKGFPGRIMEALAAGVPVVTCRLDGRPQAEAVFVHGRDLLYYDSNNPHDLAHQLDTLAADPDLQRALVRNGRSRLLQTLTSEMQMSDLQKWISREDARRPQASSGNLYHLVSHHNTILYVDKDSQQLRHARFGEVQLNLALELVDDGGRLVAWPEVQQVSVSDPSGKVTIHPDRIDSECWIERLPSGLIGIRIGEYYLSADADGVVRNDRTHCRDWEHFRLIKVREETRATAAMAGTRHEQSHASLDKNLQVVTLPRTRVVEVRSGRYLLFESPDVIGHTLSTEGSWDPLTQKIAGVFLEQAMSGGTIIDAGANFGAFTIPIAKRFAPDFRVFSFEVQRIVFYQLCGNVILNSLGNVFPQHVGLSDSPAVIDIPVPDYRMDFNVGGLSIDPEVRRMRGLTGVHAPTDFQHSQFETVRLNTLDSFGLIDVRLIKLDVEGVELRVLQGARDTVIASEYPPIIFESWDDKVVPSLSTKRAEVSAYLDTLGYDVDIFEDVGIAQHRTHRKLTVQSLVGRDPG